MNILLDTCVFLWIIRDAPDLSATVRELYADPGNDVYLSSVSVWEIVVKHQLGRLPLPDPPHLYVPRERVKHGILPLALDETSVLGLRRLPSLHGDPFDRMLICQAIAHGLVLLSPDPQIHDYPVNSRW